VKLPLQANALISGLVRQQVLLARCRAGGHQAGCAGVAAPALCNREAEVQRQQGLQHRSVLLRILMLERDRRTRHDEALAERACHHQRRNQGTEGLARSGAGLDHRDVFTPAATTFIRILPAASQSVRDSGDHLELGTPRPEASDAVPQRVHALPDKVLVGVGQHRSRLRVNPARSSHRVALVRLVLRGLTEQDGFGQGRNDVNDQGLAPRQSKPCADTSSSTAKPRTSRSWRRQGRLRARAGNGGAVADRHDAAGVRPDAGNRGGAGPAGLALFGRAQGDQGARAQAPRHGAGRLLSQRERLGLEADRGPGRVHHAAADSVYVNSCERVGDRAPAQVVHFQMNVPDLPGPSADADWRRQPVPLRSHFNRMRSTG
jgi:hypothetical protein